jgi:hypothetical protein
MIEGASAALVPHTQRLAGVIDEHGRKITEQLDEMIRQSDVGRPDTGDKFKFINVLAKLPATKQTFDNLMPGFTYDDGGPTVGEIWMVQTLCVNGQSNKSPGFAIRTNTGRLVFAVVPEGMGNENTGGNVYILQGEVLVFEPLAEGTFDFTLTVVQRKFPRGHADAGWGVSEEHYEQRSRAFEHEADRDFPGEAFPVEQDQYVGGNISPDAL